MNRFWAFCKAFVNSDLGGCLTAFFFLPLGLGAAFWVLDQWGLSPVVEAFFLLLKFLGEFFSEHILWFMFGSLAAAIAYAFIEDYLDKRR